LDDLQGSRPYQTESFILKLLFLSRGDYKGNYALISHRR
ncbi:unnamed protein product, partial [Brassica rapa subsp. narinosa]